MGDRHVDATYRDSRNHRARSSLSPVVKNTLTDAQLRRRRKSQAVLTTTGASLGLAALGAKGSAGVIRRSVKPAEKAAKLADKLDSHTTGILTLGAGVGGIGGFNAASIYRDEAKRKNQKVKKAWDDSPFDVERRRKKTGKWAKRERRSHKVQIGAETATGVLGAGLGAGALRDAYARENPGKLEAYAAKKTPHVERLLLAKPNNFKYLAAAGTAGATAAGARNYHQMSQRKVRRYSKSGHVQKSALSAFGVDHG